ncbi:SAF domain-containing protein [Nocardia wallacei]|uniref:SAF domain-containing protein n=1 Tax=Nocardia wallacei TaxID=480035 RepID=UPI002456D04B|nr:SAF domain-containing protein [Nocardia wallacei]
MRRRPRRDADLGREPHWDRLIRYRPAWADAALARRVLAAALVVLAGALYLRGDPDTHPVDIVVAARDLSPGHVLETADLHRVPRPAGMLPEGALRDVAPVLGATVTGPVRAGEILTDLRVLGPRLATAATGAREARIVPIRLADNAVADILRTGDRVDVIAGAEHAAEGAHGPAPPHTLATDAVVVLIAGAAKARGSDERVVLVALDPAPATIVAAASLTSALTVVFH